MDQVIRNLTPHPVTIISPDCCEFNNRTRSYSLNGEAIILRTIAPEEGVIPRVSTSEVDMATIDGIPTIGISFGEVENLPEEVPGTWLIVSAIVATAGRAKGRKDLLVPSRMVRDAAGAIVGCLALGRE